MRIRHSSTTLKKIELQMTPMIDIVFLLIIFFAVSFRIVLPEGDFNVRMPSSTPAQRLDVSETLPITLVLKARPDGELAELRLADKSFGNERDAFARLHRHIRALVDHAGGPGTTSDLEIEFDCDYHLNYEYVIRAITATTGYIENGQQHKLIERIKFTQPKQQKDLPK